MLSLLMFVFQNRNVFLTDNENHNIDTIDNVIIYTFLKQT